MKVKKGKDERIFLGIAYVLVAVFAVVCLLPFYLVLVGSFTKESTILTEGYSFFLTAKNFSLEAYKNGFQKPGYPGAGVWDYHFCNSGWGDNGGSAVRDDRVCTGKAGFSLEK